MGDAHGGSPLLIWIWLILAGVAIGVPAIVVVAAVMLRARASRSALPARGPSAGSARAHIRRVTFCGLGGFGVGAVIGVALIADNRAGLAVLACAGGYMAGLLLGEFVAQPPVSGPVRTAGLLARRPADYVPRWAAAAVVLSAAMALAAPIAFALAPSVRYGSWHPAAGVSVTLPGGHTSWPPAFPGTVSAAVLVIAVLAVAAVGLRRVAARPSPADDAYQAVDEMLRRQAGRAILGAALGLELITLAGILIAGSAGLAVPVPATSPAAYVGNRVMVIAGLSCAAFGLAAWLLLSGSIRRGRVGTSPADARPR